MYIFIAKLARAAKHVFMQILARYRDYKVSEQRQRDCTYSEPTVRALARM